MSTKPYSVRIVSGSIVSTFNVKTLAQAKALAEANPGATITGNTFAAVLSLGA
jgi:hypothetical protein